MGFVVANVIGHQQDFRSMSEPMTVADFRECDERLSISSVKI